MQQPPRPAFPPSSTPPPPTQPPLQIKGYPTLKVIHDGEEVKAYRGGRRAEGGAARKGGGRRDCASTPAALALAGPRSTRPPPRLHPRWPPPSTRNTHTSPRKRHPPTPPPLPAGARELDALKKFIEETATEVLTETTE